MTILRIQYKIARIPLQLIETNVVEKMNAESPARLVYEHTLGSLDRAVGNLLGDKSLADRGETLVDSTENRAEAARLDAEARAKKAAADDELKVARETAEKDRRAADAAAQEAARDARQEAEQRKREAAQ
ncbi:MAG: hypothetical protein JHD12_21505, partial [Rhodococcus sp.]|nr:hypothetical protein [Rhodococcus sp. (in: high G+C Gram-positive bacteria)]